MLGHGADMRDLPASPAAAPVLVILYLASLYLTVRPWCDHLDVPGFFELALTACHSHRSSVYCSVIISFVLLSTSYHPLFPPSPASSLGLTSTTPELVPPNLSLPLAYLEPPTQADPERGWLDLNAGHLLDPVGVAFKHRTDVVELESAKLEAVLRAEAVARERAEAERRLALGLEAEKRTLARKALDSLTGLFRRAPAPTPAVAPVEPVRSVHARDPATPRWDSRRRRLDLRWNGIGAILDLGFGRSAEEVQEGLEAAARRRVGRRTASRAAIKDQG